MGLLSRFANSAGIQTRLEPAVGEGKERADIAFSFTSDITLVDVTVVHNQCPTHRAKASRALGLASWAEREKLYQYEAKAKKEGKRFVPVVYETSLGLGTLAVSFLETLFQECRWKLRWRFLAYSLLLSSQGRWAFNCSLAIPTSC